MRQSTVAHATKDQPYRLFSLSLNRKYSWMSFLRWSDVIKKNESKVLAMKAETNLGLNH